MVKSCVGRQLQGISRDLSLCAYTIWAITCWWCPTPPKTAALAITPAFHNELNLRFTHA